ncbi:hypothetical protein VB774_21065 [Pseudanabaena galeata UHCC 0370]|uniref:Uncharacterized protein n=1 Tax=Pseudanabaena galeata UHCC 0370 TaxID=3110310 RepID=A0ABU5TP60_9CYAN|nr:hypothetical protein [Pseudanabaena galeata]MEA5480128.1 hypothetical protein [Pseudanabaena galeata UHCC 0370]
MTLDIFDIDDEELLRMNQIEEECSCDVIAGVDHGANLGNYLRQTMNSISYDQLREILNSKTGKVLSSEDVDEIVSEIQSQMLITDSELMPILTAKSA